MSSKNFDSYAAYYDLLYRDKDYDKEAGHVAELIREMNPNAVDVLELGCGTGIHARIMAKDGFKIVGIDQSRDMLAIAEQRNEELKTSRGVVPPRFLQSDIRDFEVDGDFDAVILLFDVVSYLTSNQDLRAMLSRARRHIRADGVLLFDCWYGPAVYTQRPEPRVKRIESSAYRVVRIAEPDFDYMTNVVDVNYEVYVHDRRTKQIDNFKELHRMRCYFDAELDEILEDFGFDRRFSRQWFTQDEPNEKSWSVLFGYGLAGD